MSDTHNTPDPFRLVEEVGGDASLLPSLQEWLDAGAPMREEGPTIVRVPPREVRRARGTFPDAVARASRGAVTVNLLAVLEDALPAPAIYACASCACLFWPDVNIDGFIVDRYAHVGTTEAGACSGDPNCACHQLPEAITLDGKVMP